jgi:hypothetical protein
VPAAPAVTIGPPLLDPFPIVRIRGWLTRGGARVTLLSVRAPRGTRIAAACFGRSCRVRRYARASVRTRLRPFERVLAAGTRLEIRVTKPGFVGKWTTIVIRRNSEPRRWDRCVQPGARRPEPCPPV